MTDDKTNRARSKAVRSGQALRRGQEVMDHIDSKKDLLVSAAHAGKIPVTVVGKSLLQAFGEDVKPLTVRQFIGLYVRVLLSEEGFVVFEKGIRVDDPLFRSGSTYRKIGLVDGGALDHRLVTFFRRMIGAMEDGERRALEHALLVSKP